MWKMSLTLLTVGNIDKLVSVKRMVIRCSSIIPEIEGAFFKCLVCGHSPPLLSVVKGKFPFFNCVSHNLITPRRSLVNEFISLLVVS
jgi:DNA replicative helicase MCM subunit Mcm2 (Cdc46/Mcm family)